MVTRRRKRRRRTPLPDVSRPCFLCLSNAGIRLRVVAVDDLRFHSHRDAIDIPLDIRIGPGTLSWLFEWWTNFDLLAGRVVPEDMLQTDTRVGLTEHEVQARRKKYGLNQMKEEKESKYTHCITHLPLVILPALHLQRSGNRYSARRR